MKEAYDAFVSLTVLTTMWFVMLVLAGAIVTQLIEWWRCR